MNNVVIALGIGATWIGLALWLRRSSRSDEWAAITAHQRVSDALNRTSTTPALRAASAGEWRGGGLVPTDEPGRAEPPGRAAHRSTPSRLGGGVDQLVPH